MYSSTLKRLAIKISKTCNDLRLLSSGPPQSPRAGLNEINLPKVQPGSSIIPGKVNPVFPEVVNQIAFKVIGNDLSVTLAAEAGQLQPNAMLPVIAQSLLESIDMLCRGLPTLKIHCVVDITTNRRHCLEMVENSIGLVTALSPVLGYELCSEIAKVVIAGDKSIFELVLKRKLISQDRLGKLLNLENMVKKPGD